ncbi:MAG: hypothetical protein ACI8XO_002267 [Verrucomicrobiales bacterium]|jgi:hypothetical protein
MAQTEITTGRQRERAELIAALSESRAGMARGAGEVVDFVNVPKRIKQTLSDTPLKRAATALVAGFISSKLLSKKKQPDHDDEKSSWFHRLFPDFDPKNLFSLLLTSYLEPDKIDLESMLKTRLRDFLK